MKRQEHKCHAMRCGAPCPPKHLFCARHWKLTPQPLKERICAAYRPGQEKDKKPSKEWLKAALEARWAVARAEVLVSGEYPFAKGGE